MQIFLIKNKALKNQLRLRYLKKLKILSKVLIFHFLVLHYWEVNWSKIQLTENYILLVHTAKQTVLILGSATKSGKSINLYLSFRCKECDFQFDSGLKND